MYNKNVAVTGRTIRETTISVRIKSAWNFTGTYMPFTMRDTGHSFVI